MLLADRGAGLQPKTAWLQTGTAAVATTTAIDSAVTIIVSGSALAFIAESADPPSTSIRCPHVCTKAAVR